MGATLLARVKFTKAFEPGATKVEGEKVAVIPAGGVEMERLTRLLKLPLPPAAMFTEVWSPAMTRAVAGGAGAALSEKSPVVCTVNVRLAEPREVVTTSNPVVAPMGTVFVSCVALIVRTTAARPLNVTVVAPGSKFVPVIVTNIPTVPLAGSTVVIEGPKRTVKVRTAGVGSSFPTRSRAFTSKVCGPSVRLFSVAVVAEANALKAPPSRRQANRRLPTGVRLSEP